MFLVPLSRSSAESARQFERLFDDHLDRAFAPAATGDTARSPALDVAETESAFTVHMDLPGVAKQDVQVSIDGRRITVQAQARREEERKEGERVVHRERAVASFARSFTLPVEVDQAQSGARLDNGVLTLTLSKRGARTASRLNVD
jgi:HSP20 family protein